MSLEVSCSEQGLLVDKLLSIRPILVLEWLILQLLLELRVVVENLLQLWQ